MLASREYMFFAATRSWSNADFAATASEVACVAIFSASLCARCARHTSSVAPQVVACAAANSRWDAASSVIISPRHPGSEDWPHALHQFGYGHTLSMTLLADPLGLRKTQKNQKC